MEEKTLSPGDILEIVKYRKWGLILPFILVFIISCLVAVLLPSQYKSTSTILIEEQEIPSDFVMATVTSYIEKRLQTINQRIMSTGTLVEIINQFNLYADMREKYTIEEIVEEMRGDINMQSIDAEVIDRRTGRPTTATIAFTLAYQGENPGVVHKVTNVLTSLYLKENVEIRSRQAKETSSFLEEELKRVKEDLDNINIEITALKESHLNELPEMMQMNLQGLAGAERNINLFTEKLSSLNEKKEYLEIQLSNISSEDMDLNKRRLDELRLMLIDLQTKFSDNYPDIVKVKKEIKAVEKDIRKSEEKEKTEGYKPDNPTYISFASQLAGIKSEIEMLKKNLADAEADKEKYQHRLNQSPGIEKQYNNLIMEQVNTQRKYNDLMAKLMEAKIAQGLEQDQKGERFTLIDPPRFPEKPFKPNRFAIMLIGLVLSIGAAVGTVAVEEMMDTTVRKPESLAVFTHERVLGSVPEILTAEDIAVQKKRKRVWAGSVAGGFVLCILLFHFVIMDLNIFWAKAMRHIAR